jgi:hypothetical protein
VRARTGGCGSSLTLAAMSNLSVEDNCGIGELWGGDFQCVYYPFAGGGGDVNVLTPVVVHGGTQRVSMLAMGCPSSPFIRLFMCYDFASWRSKNSSVVIHHAVTMCCGGQLWMLSGFVK